jgi:hypothetical protein
MPGGEGAVMAVKVSGRPAAAGQAAAVPVRPMAGRAAAVPGCMLAVAYSPAG